MFKTRLRTFGEHFWAFLEFWNFFDFWKHFEDSTLHATLGKKTFRKNYPKTCSKHVWTLLGTILGILENLKLFWFFENISKTRPSMEHWGKKFFENINPNHVQNTFGHFSERYWAFLEFWKFLIFWKHFEDSTLHGTLGKKKIFWKHYPKTCSKHVWQFWERFRAFMEFWEFFDFLKTFRRLDFPCNTGQINFLEKLPQNMFKTRSDTFGEHFRLFLEFWKIFDFWKHFEDSNLHGTLGKKMLRKNNPKTCSKHLWTFLGTILGIFGILKIFWFFENVSKTRPSMEHWAKKFFLISYPKTCSKHVCALLGNIFGHFWNFETFSIFENISKTRPSMQHWAKKLFGKITPKLVQNMFGHFWERFWAFLKIWIFFDFLRTFRRLDPPSNTGQKKIFRKNYPKTCSKHVCALLGTIFGQLRNFEKFLIFQKHFEDSTLHGTMSKKNCSKKLPQSMFKTRLDILGRILGISGFLKIF